MLVATQMLRTWLSFRENVFLSIRSLSSRHSRQSFPSPPTKHLSGYNLFVKALWPSLRQQNPEKSFLEVASLTAKKWKAADKKTKQMYVSKAQELLAQYEEQYLEHLSRLSSEQIEAASQEAEAAQLKAKNRRFKERLRRLKKPRAPRSAYAFFCIEHSQRDVSLGEMSKLVAKKWKSLSDSEKQVYRQQAEDDKRRYRDEMINWEMHLQQTGNSRILQQYLERKCSNVPVNRQLVKQLTTSEGSLGG